MPNLKPLLVQQPFSEFMISAQGTGAFVMGAEGVAPVPGNELAHLDFIQIDS